MEGWKFVRKKPVIVQAVKWSYLKEDLKRVPNNMFVYQNANGVWTIRTLEGEYPLRDDDYIIMGVKGEYYPCRKDIFEETYVKAR